MLRSESSCAELGRGHGDENRARGNIERDMVATLFYLCAETAELVFVLFYLFRKLFGGIG